MRMQPVYSLHIDEGGARTGTAFSLDNGLDNNNSQTSGEGLLEACERDGSLFQAVLGTLAIWDLTEDATREVMRAATRLQFDAGCSVVSQVRPQSEMVCERACLRILGTAHWL